MNYTSPKISSRYKPVCQQVNQSLMAAVLALSMVGCTPSDSTSADNRRPIELSEKTESVSLQIEQQPRIEQREQSVERATPVTQRPHQKQTSPQVLNQLMAHGRHKLLLLEDFESGEIEQIGKCSGNCPYLITQNGQRFMRAELAADMPFTFRTELSFGNRTSFWMDTATYLIHVQVRFHPDSGEGFPRSMFIQTHMRSKEPQKNMVWESFVGRILGSGKGLWQAERLSGKKVGDEFPFNYGEWNECLILLRLSQNEDGRIMVYRNGKVEFDRTGSNSGPWEYSQYLKMGIYAASHRTDKAGLSNARRVVDFDNLVVWNVTRTVDCESVNPLSFLWN